jgi:alkanesulfonate monooxygenase SsuD/methylene tetrahydromethanopterin reductase-like flavin-dependent oxidoreductase (luciferase family)
MEVRGRPLHFGVQLQAQRSSWADYVAALRGVEDLGFGSVWTFDHMLPFAGRDDGAAFETLTTLSAMALLTSKARIGVLVNGVLYRDPATLAKAAAQVDQMSGGRLDFTLGAAWAEREFRAYGLPFPSRHERYQRLDEALQVVKMLWGQHRSTFKGQYYELNDAPCEPKPVQSPLPIMVGGSGLGSLRIAARHAHRLNIMGAFEYCRERLARFEALCAEEGRDFEDIELSLHPSMALAPSAAEAEELAASYVAANDGDLEAARQSWLIGDPGTVAAGLRRFLGLGISHFVIPFGHPFDMAPLELFMTEVMPQLG